MRSMQIISWGEPLELRHAETPRPVGREILVQVEACGVCHSDLHIWEGFFDLGNGQRFPIESRGVTPPFTLGHEPVGKVVAMGPEAEGIEVGRSYVIYPWINCGSCPACRTGMTQVCDQPRIIGTRVDGAYADHVIVPDGGYLVPYDGVEQNLASTLACSGLTGYSALKKIDPGSLTEKDSILILGAGGLGLTAICLARRLSAARILVADIDAAKRQAALDLGAELAVDPADADAVAQFKSVVESDDRLGIAASIDFVGLPQTMKLGLDTLRKGGVHIHVGLFGGAHSLSLPPLAFKMLRIMGSYVGTLAEFRQLVGLVQAGLRLPIPIATRPLEEANQALEDLREGRIIGRTVLRP